GGRVEGTRDDSGSVRVGADAAAFVLVDLVLVDDPFQGAAVAEAVLERLRRDAGEGQRRVYAQGCFVLAQPHLVLDVVGQWHAIRRDPLQRIRLQLFVIEVQRGQ